MLWLLLLQVISCFEGLSGAEHETLCTSNTCFTAHMKKLTFNKAKRDCEDRGGYLTTIRDRREEEALRSLLSSIQSRDMELEFWIGLKLKQTDCVFPNKALRGFKWVSGEEESHYSNWREQPILTCLAERCVHINYNSSGENHLEWVAAPCKKHKAYACTFYFKGMCKPLAVHGSEQITYTVPFLHEPLRSQMMTFPHGTYANIQCGDQQDHSSVCTIINHVYRWTNPGPFCKTGKQSCAISRGGCEQVCREDAGEIRCSCREGYELERDGFSCRMKDLCGPDTCEHQCVMSESGFFCKCPEGFELHENQHNCSDVDECQSQACKDGLCVNTQGSYTCACRDGFEMVDGRCRDVDECAQRRCEHICLNSPGSFACYCKDGFTLSGDGHSCEDINECVDSCSAAEFECVNTAGSFLCTHLRTSDRTTLAPHVTFAASTSADDAADEETPENFTESLTRTAVELQHQSPRPDPPSPGLQNATGEDQPSNATATPSFAKMINSRVIICVLGSVVPLVVLVAVTVFIAVFRCSRSKKEVKKNATADGYCWVSSGLDPRLEKLYESILTDDP